MNSNQTFIFEQASKERFSSLISLRNGETKLGETIVYGQPVQSTRYIILGIEESIGPQANQGLPGAENSFRCFAQRFLNMQSNRFVNGEEIALIGTIRSNAPFENIDSGRQRIEELDALVQQVLDEHLLGEIVPIVIGGGHNNAYPVICAISKHLNQPINVINLDPHADCRALEGRHSGNPFSYAKNENFLDHYTVLGLHKPYNSEFILSYLDENEFNYTFFEDYIEDPEKFKTDIRRFNAGIAAEKPFGVELDLDSMEGMPSSAFTPSGINTSQARFYISHLSKNPNAAYFHFPEGAPSTPHEEKIVGKTLAYLVWDIIS